jgi:hypothetical protein
MSISSPVNDTQRRFNVLCARGGGQRGGPPLTSIQNLLHDSGAQLTLLLHRDITSTLSNFPGSNPWHVCFVLGICWGRLARLDPEFVAAALRLIDNWNDSDLRTARQFHYERGPEPIDHSLMGGHLLFQRVVLPPALPNDLNQCRRAQERWLARIISPERPRYIGSWNATAMFMAAVASDVQLFMQLTTPVVMLPPGGPVFNALSILHRVHILSSRPSGNELDDEAFEPGAIYENNALFQEIHRGHDGWNLLDVHSGLYMLGTHLAESDTWF